MKGNCESSAIFAAKAVLPLWGGPEGKEGNNLPSACVCVCISEVKAWGERQNVPIYFRLAIAADWTQKAAITANTHDGGDSFPFRMCARD